MCFILTVAEAEHGGAALLVFKAAYLLMLHKH